MFGSCSRSTLGSPGSRLFTRASQSPREQHGHWGGGEGPPHGLGPSGVGWGSSPTFGRAQHVGAGVRRGHEGARPEVRPGGCSWELGLRRGSETSPVPSPEGRPLPAPSVLTTPAVPVGREPPVPPVPPVRSLGVLLARGGPHPVLGAWWTGERPPRRAQLCLLRSSQRSVALGWGCSRPLSQPMGLCTEVPHSALQVCPQGPRLGWGLRSWSRGGCGLPGSPAGRGGGVRTASLTTGGSA